jgi:hypothetical protein
MQPQATDHALQGLPSALIRIGIGPASSFLISHQVRLPRSKTNSIANDSWLAVVWPHGAEVGGGNVVQVFLMCPEIVAGAAQQFPEPTFWQIVDEGQAGVGLDGKGAIWHREKMARSDPAHLFHELLLPQPRAGMFKHRVAVNNVKRVIVKGQWFASAILT